MIGGLQKTVSRLAIVAAAGAMTSTAAMAADLGGNCCSDLEERVAELEATTARKGNRRVSLTVSGALAVNVFWHNSDATTGAVRADEVRISGNTGNDVPSYFKFSGSAAINGDLTAGFVMDIDVYDQNTRTDPLEVDDLYLYLDSKRLGRISLGRVDGAMDGINAISLATITDVQLDEAGVIGVLGGGTGFFSVGDLDGDDDLGGTVRYDSPTIRGFKFSASWSNDEEDASNNDEVWSVALRYAGEFGAIRVGAGIGYEERNGGFNTTANDDIDRETFTGSVSVMHVPTGLFINFAAGTEETTGSENSVLSRDVEGWAVVAGVERKWNSLGKTTLFANVNWNEDNLVTGRDTTNWGLGIVQQIDAAAMTLSLQYNRFECVTVTGATCTDDADTIQFGSVIKF